MTPSEHFQICQAELLADLEAEHQAELVRQRAEIDAEIAAELQDLQEDA